MIPGDAGEGLIIDGRRVPVPGVRVVTWLDDPRVPKAVHGGPREASAVTGSVAHTSRGKRAGVTRDKGSAAKGLRVARYLGRKNGRKVSAHAVIAGDGTVYQLADLARWKCNHAGTVNEATFGVEVAQDDGDPSLTRAQVAAFVAVMVAAHDAMGLVKQIPMERGEHVIGDVRAWLSPKSGGEGKVFAGCAGHRNTSASRGENDPGTPLMEALRPAGFVGVSPAAMTCTGGVCEDDDRPDDHDDDDDTTAWPPLPSWLDPALELDASDDLTDDLAALVHSQAPVLAALGVTGERAAELLAHAATETGRGRRAHGHNWGGVKVKERDHAEAVAKTGRGLRWWRDFGHAGSGDDDVVYYRAWESDEAFWRFFVKRYVGGPSLPTESERYTAAGMAFWGPTPRGWFVELLRGGYRGEVRQREVRETREPEKHPSVVKHRGVVERVRAMLA